MKKGERQSLLSLPPIKRVTPAPIVLGRMMPALPATMAVIHSY